MFSRPERRNPSGLLDFDVSADFNQLCFDLFSFGFGNAFFDSFATGFNQIFSFFQAQAGDGADFFDDVDFLFASGFQNNVKFGLFFNSFCCCSRTSRQR